MSAARARRGVAAALLIAATVAGCGNAGRPVPAADYPATVNSASADSRDASEGFYVTFGAVRGASGRVEDPDNLERLSGPLANWRAEVALLVEELEDMRPDGEAADLHAEGLAAQRAKLDALLAVEEGVDDEDVTTFEAGMRAVDRADARDDAWRERMESAGLALPFAGRTTGSGEPPSKKVRDQSRRAYEVAVDNATRDSAEASADSAEELGGLPAGPALAANPGALESVAPALDEESAAASEAADELETIAPGDDAAGAHADLVVAERERSVAAADMADAARDGDLQGFQSAQADYERALSDRSAAADALGDAGYNLAVLGAEEGEGGAKDARYGQHLPRAKPEK